MLQDEKILITGVGGAVALPLAQALARDNEVWGVARFTDPANLDLAREAGIVTRAVDIAEGDLSGLPDDFTYVLHLAYFRGGADDFETSFRINAEGTGFVLRHCRKAKAALVMSSHVIYTSTEDPCHRYREEEPVGGERTPWAPTANTAKVAEEAVARFCARAFDLPVTIARLNTVYGPDPRYMPMFHGLAVAAGKDVTVRGDPCPHTPISTEDMVWQLEPLLAAAGTPATVVNWCGDNDVTVHHWCDIAASVSQSAATVVVTPLPGSPCKNAADPARRLALTGPCRVKFDDGYAKALRMLLERPDHKP